MASRREYVGDQADKVDPISSDPSSQARASLTFSIVSHDHGPLVTRLIEDLGRVDIGSAEIVLTRNVPETNPEPLPRADGQGLSVREIHNCRPRGFGANHNTAFSVSSGEIFVVLNPDVRIRDDLHTVLVAALLGRDAIVAPSVVNESGDVENSARRFPSPSDIVRKALAVYLRLPVGPNEAPWNATSPDWVAGIFMAFPRSLYASLGGFDERYFMYYEDVDICARAHRAGATVELLEGVCIEHAARRDSRHRVAFLRRHVRSAIRYYASEAHRRTRAHRSS